MSADPYKDSLDRMIDGEMAWPSGVVIDPQVTPSAEDIYEVLREHQPTTGMSVASGVTCKCGYWNGDERAGVDRPIGLLGLGWHQSQEIAALFASQRTEAEVKAEAFEQAARESEDAFLTHEMPHPKVGPFTIQQNAADEARGQIAAKIRALDPATPTTNGDTA